MKRLLPFTLIVAAALFVGNRSPALSCASCVTSSLELEYLGSPSRDNPMQLEKIETWDVIRLHPLDTNEKPTESQFISISVEGG